MLDLEEILNVTNKIFGGVNKKYSQFAISCPQLKDYEIHFSEHLRQGLFTERISDLKTFTESSQNNSPPINSLDLVTTTLKQEFSSGPKDDKQVRRALKLIAKWSALATLGYEDNGIARNKTIKLITDFCTDYNTQPFLLATLDLAYQDTKQLF